MATSWLDGIVWSRPHSISELTSSRGARIVIPQERGYYAFVEGCRTPAPEHTLYLGVAVSERGLYGRLGSYLRATVNPAKAAQLKHRGKRLITFARINGVNGAAGDPSGVSKNDSFIHLSWARCPLDFSGRDDLDAREYAFMLERALVEYLRPLYNTADYDADLELDLDEDFIP